MDKEIIKDELWESWVIQDLIKEYGPGDYNIILRVLEDNCWSILIYKDGECVLPSLTKIETDISITDYSPIIKVQGIVLD